MPRPSQLQAGGVTIITTEAKWWRDLAGLTLVLHI
jgi:hypothetical protein